MALNYLLAPEFQISVTSGKPNTGGWIEVFLAGTQTKYFTSCDFNGTKNPFRIPLDSLGQALVLAEDSTAYDVFVYNRYGTQLFSRYNVTPGKGGGGLTSTSITSQDGSLTVTQTEQGVDLSVNGATPSVLRASAATLTEDGNFAFTEVQRDGEKAIVSQGKVLLDEGWYHYDVTVKFVWNSTPTNTSVPVIVSTNNCSHTNDFDCTYAHEQTIQLSGEFKSTAANTEFTVSVSGIPTGMNVELTGFGIHSITGVGSVAPGPDYTAGRNISISDNVISYAPSRAWRSMHGSTWSDCGDAFGFLVDDNYYDPDGLITVVKGTNEDSEHNVTHWGEIHIAAGHAAIVMTSVTLYRKPDELQPTANCIALWYGGNPVSIYGARHEFMYDNSQVYEVVPQICAYIPATENGARITLGCSAGVDWYSFKPTELWVAVLD